jgi:type II secretory pathway pseudopilin PulG
MSVVITILVLMAAAVMPNLVAIARSRQFYNAEQTLWRLPMEARNEASKSQEPVTLRLEGDTFVMERPKPDDDQNNTTTNVQNSSQNNQDMEEVKRVDFSGGLHAESARKNGDTSDLASWKWTVYPDGTSDSGGVAFTEGNSRKSLVLSATADAHWIQGDLPTNDDNDHWPAGQLQTRGTTTTP